MSDINKNILTLSVVVGEGCNADCKFCISKLTFKAEYTCPYWWAKLEKACEVAKRGGADTVLLTSKGEPTTDTDLPRVVQICAQYFPIVELQTNGIKLTDKNFVETLAVNGLTTVAVSCVSYKKKDNQAVISKNCPDLKKIVGNCREYGLLTRACVIMTKDICGTPCKIKKQIAGFKLLKFDQVTLRIMGTPDISLIQDTKKAKQVANWIEKNRIEEGNVIWHNNRHKIHNRLSTGMCYIREWINQYPLLREFPWGSDVYSIEGISVCLAECLSDEHGNDYRYVIYFPDGHLRTRWDVSGTMLF